ncbi:MAG: hypothetical protein A2511_17075 [Deltaproteobacteria bacterium RIFOXYD12_FULL_50_9]|nr:MAG: hypothetical protein A2511_17075 [Deltaproteobacteria bacterium RIFOXYD12_FULL_50_9]
MSTDGNSILQNQQHDLRIFIFSLVVACPINRNPREDCPFSKIREDCSLEEKYHYAENLFPYEAVELIEYHNKCYERQIMAIKAAARCVRQSAKI